MATRIHLSSLQLKDPDYRMTASIVAQRLQENGFAVIQLAQSDTEKLETLQALMEDTAMEWKTEGYKAVLHPSKQLPGRDIYEYSLGQEVYDLPALLQKTTPQAFDVLNNAAKVILTALTKSLYLRTKSTVFDSILDDPLLEPGQVSSSRLDAIHYASAEDANDVGGCQTHEDKGLLTIIFADGKAGLQVIHPKQQQVQNVIIPSGCVAVLPGYTLERASCGIFKAAFHKVDMTHVVGDRLALAFKLRALPSAVINLYPELPLASRPHIKSRYTGSISVAELMWVFDKTHTSINAPTASSVAIDNEDEQHEGQDDICEERDASFEANVMSISIQQLCGTVLNFHMDGRWGVYRLKARIQSATKIAMHQQKLTLAGISLRHDQSLIRAGLQNQDAVELTVTESALPADMITVFVKHHAVGCTDTVSIDASWHVVHLKRILEGLHGIPVHQQRLLFYGKQIEDALGLSCCGVINETTVLLVLRLRGD